MVYDQGVDVQSVNGPVKAEIVIRSQQAPKRSHRSNSRMSAQEDTPRKLFGADNGQRIDIDKFAQKLRGVTAQTSSQKCAKSVRIALESAGAKFNNHPVAAADWGNTLQKIGYERINQSFDRPKKGDIYIINRTQKHVYGHIAAYTGSNWVSDFQQSGYAVYKDPNVRYEYYRLNK
ncbi:CHAP domain-containing protein [Acinetobacter cumulans]|jgi:surface antigen|uniref:CHAP domain-containing protein n=1 Tax=Acinetobacter cumulans TaxID=2136182 RepID=A0A498D4T7_9GAMM|nr:MULTISPECIES: peptidoglycan amidohydrolase family protein [Acinetobacter]NWK73494.1 CHAP domain-containing protein [Acinetobacter sp. SwsAc6]RLL38772.1 CHAP domain-containing protein [Acinetobacter cumulans]RLL49222.1 CHAP domain-containing protein [Acinetobacter cumulans]